MQVASAEFDRQGQEYDEERLIDQITETLKVGYYMRTKPASVLSRVDVEGCVCYLCCSINRRLLC